jgi:lipopolysaccharide biosynthesis glycosyltransferase
MLVSLFENNKDEKINIFLFSDHLSSDNQKNINQIVKNYNQKIIYQLIDLKNIEYFKVSDHASLANYYRVLAFSLLPKNIKKILYLDVDLLVLESINDLYSSNIDNYLLGVVKEPTEMLKNKELLDIPVQYSYFNSGVMLVNIEKWKQIDATLKIINFIQNNADKIQFWDQDALNALFYDDCILIHKKWNIQSGHFNTSKNIKKEDIKILHFTGKSKPWEYMNKHPLKQLYYKYLKKTPWKHYKPKDKTLGNMLRKYKLMPNWYEKLFKKQSK